MFCFRNIFASSEKLIWRLGTLSRCITQTGLGGFCSRDGGAPGCAGSKSYAALVALTADDPRTIVAKSTSPAAIHTAAA
jgi:hypothetical protein